MIIDRNRERNDRRNRNGEYGSRRVRRTLNAETPEDQRDRDLNPSLIQQLNPIVIANLIARHFYWPRQVTIHITITAVHRSGKTDSNSDPGRARALLSCQAGVRRSLSEMPSARTKPLADASGRSDCPRPSTTTAVQGRYNVRFVRNKHQGGCRSSKPAPGSVRPGLTESILPLSDCRFGIHVGAAQPLP